jgi:hypothetical protein
MAVTLACLGLAAFVLRRHLGKALVFLWPGSLRFAPGKSAEEAELAMPAALRPWAGLLEGLGFGLLGTRLERPLLGRGTVVYELANAATGVFASLFLEGDEVRLYFLSRGEDGALVLTANYHRPARERAGRYATGGLENVAPERVYKAHLRRIEALRPAGPYDAAGRLLAARAFLAGPGRVELRWMNLHGLLWSLGTVGILIAALLGKR